LTVLNGSQRGISVHMEQENIEYINVIGVIWRRKVLIFLGVLSCIVLAVVVSFFLPEVYRASVTFLLEESRSSHETAVSQINPQIFETYGKTYEGLIKNKGAIQKAIKQFSLYKEPYSMRFNDIAKSVNVNVVRNSRLIELTVELPDAVIARDVANYLADKAVERNNALSVTGSDESKEFIKRQMDVAKVSMGTAEKKLLRFKQKAMIEVLRKRRNILLSRKGAIENELPNIVVAIAANVERLKRIKEELKKRNRTVKLSRNLAENPLYQQSLAELSEVNIKKLFNLNMEVEVANPAYEHLEQKLVDVIPTLGSFFAKKDALLTELKKNTSEFKILQAELADKETQLERLQRTYNLTVETYKMFVKKFETIAMQVASRNQDLKIIDQAVIPDKPIKPKKALNVLIAGVLGLVFFCFIAFFMEYLESVGKRD